MEYLLLAVVIVLVTFQSVARKEYNKKTEKSNAYTFSAVNTLFALLFFVFSSGFKLRFTGEVLVYSVFFGMAFAMAQAGSFFAIKWGALSITLLVTSYSLLIPALYGVLFLKERLSTLGIVGLVLLAISLFMIYDRKEKAMFSLKWLISVVIAFVGNGLCSTIQKMQQLAFDGGFKHEFMIMALAICLVFNIIMAMANRETPRVGWKPCTGYAMLSGTANGIVNLLVMVLTAKIANSILFPSISAGGIALGFFMAIFLYRERLTRLQLAGYLIGTASVVLLNL